MIKTTKMLLNEYSNYAKPYDKIKRLVKSKELTPIVKGLYETNSTISGQYLAGTICGPSYLSFEFALSFYGLIPEAVYTFTSATFMKRKSKQYQTPFGCFTYQDIPKLAYPFGVKIITENGYTFQIATPEKALCDKLYSLSPVQNQEDLRMLLFDNLRIDENEFNKLNKEDIEILAEKYKSKNVTLLSKFIRRK